MKTLIRWKLTDGHGGVLHGTVPSKEGEDYSDRAAVRQVKAALGWQGRRCRVVTTSEGLELYPAGSRLACFITFYPFGSASK